MINKRSIIFNSLRNERKLLKNKNADNSHLSHGDTNSSKNSSIPDLLDLKNERIKLKIFKRENSVEHQSPENRNFSNLIKEINTPTENNKKRFAFASESENSRHLIFILQI